MYPAGLFGRGAASIIGLSDIEEDCCCISCIYKIKKTLKFTTKASEFV